MSEIVQGRTQRCWRLVSHAASSAICLALMLPYSHAVAQQAASGTAEPRMRWTLGARAVAGLAFEDGARVGGGGALLLGAPIVPGKWEVELSGGLLAVHDAGRVGLCELVGKRVLERESRTSPHLLLGPVLSLDVGDDVSFSGGLLLGAGVTQWLAQRGMGLVLEGGYRLLWGESGLEQILTLSTGVTFAL